jgi:hypothetical protein
MEDISSMTLLKKEISFVAKYDEMRDWIIKKFNLERDEFNGILSFMPEVPTYDGKDNFRYEFFLEAKKYLKPKSVGD